MKKGVVMEKKPRYLVVMSHDGAFYKAKPVPGCKIGEEIHFEPIFDSKGSKSPSIFHTFFNKRLIAAVAVLLLAFFPAYSWYSSTKAYAYVNIDINPSIEITVNKKFDVLELTPLNDSARQLIQELSDWRGEDVEEVTLNIIEKSKQTGMAEGQSVLIGVSYIEKGNQDLTEKIETFIQEKEQNVPVAAFEVPEEIRQQAKEEKVSVNYLMAEKIMEEKEEADVSQNHKDEKPDTPPGILKQLDEEEQEIIEQFFKDTNKMIPPGWQKKLDERELPPGLQKKLDKDHNTSEDEKHVPDSESSGEERQSDSGLPPGLEKKLNKNADEIEDVWNDLPPGLKKKLFENADDIEDILEDLPPEFREKLGEKGDELEDVWKDLPPGFKKKLNEHGGSIESMLEDLPPGLRKKFEEQGDKILSPGFFHNQLKEKIPPGQKKKDQSD